MAEHPDAAVAGPATAVIVAKPLADTRVPAGSLSGAPHDASLHHLLLPLCAKPLVQWQNFDCQVTGMTAALAAVRVATPSNAAVAGTFAAGVPRPHEPASAANLAEPAAAAVAEPASAIGFTASTRVEIPTPRVPERLDTVSGCLVTAIQLRSCQRSCQRCTIDSLTASTHCSMQSLSCASSGSC